MQWGMCCTSGSLRPPRGITRVEKRAERSPGLARPLGCSPGLCAWLWKTRPVSNDPMERPRRHLCSPGRAPGGPVSRERALHLTAHAPASANHWLRVLNLLVRWAIKRKMIRWVPWDVKMLKLQKQPRAILPVKLTRAWLSAVSEVVQMREAS